MTNTRDRWPLRLQWDNDIEVNATISATFGKGMVELFQGGNNPAEISMRPHEAEQLALILIRAAVAVRQKDAGTFYAPATPPKPGARCPRCHTRAPKATRCALCAPDAPMLSEPTGSKHAGSK